MHVSWIKLPENENSDRAEYISFCLVYFLDSKRKKEIEKEFYRN